MAERSLPPAPASTCRQALSERLAALERRWGSIVTTLARRRSTSRGARLLGALGVLGALGALGGGAAAVLATGALRGSNPPAEVDAVLPRSVEVRVGSPTEPGTSTTLVVHVSGAVLVPGLVNLKGNARVADAIGAAGGPTQTADLARMNLAEPLVDGAHLWVPEVGIEAGPALVATELPASASARSDGRVGGAAVDINRADAVALDSLPGIGPATATAIVAYRTEHGPFVSVGDLELVPGIGPAKIAALAGLIRV